MIRLKGSVNWLKAFDGMPEEGKMVAVLANLSSDLMKLGKDLAGTENALAVYIKEKPDLDNYDGKSLPGAIAGLVWLAPMPDKATVHDFRENKKYSIGWPIARVAHSQGEPLKEIVRRNYPSSYDAMWLSVKADLRDGKPFKIDIKRYDRLSGELTSFYRTRSGGIYRQPQP